MNSQDNEARAKLVGQVFNWCAGLAALALCWWLYSIWIPISYAIAISGTVFLVLLIVNYIIQEQWKRKRDGYFVIFTGGAEDGTVDYHEGEKVLELYFDRALSTIYVPTDVVWEKIMPGWAKDRKAEIMERIHKHKRGWKYEETAESHLLMSQLYTPSE